MIRILVLLFLFISQSCQAIKFDFSEPSCLMFSSQVMKCKNWSVNLNESKKVLTSLKNNKLTKLKRQPYVFVRRVFIIEQLHDVLKGLAEGNQDNRPGFCNMLAKQSKSERPFILNQNSFDSKFCTGDLAQAKRSGFLALGYSIKEIEFLYEYILKYTSTGTLSFKFKKPVPSRTMHARIILDTEKTKSLVVDRIKKLIKSKNQTTCQSPGWGSGWFPGKNITACPGEIDQGLVSQYILDSILGETSFTFSKGRGKLVRLFTDSTYSINIYSTNKQPYIVSEQVWETKTVNWKSSRKSYSL